MAIVEIRSNSRARSRTWVVGGALLVACALAQLAARGPLVPLARAGDLLFAAGGVVLVIGIGRSGSITARQPLGTGAVVALAAILLIRPFVFSAVVGATSDQATLTRVIPLATGVAAALLAVMLALAITAVAQIARAGVVPAPWRWAPLWALCVVAPIQAIPMLPLPAVPGDGDLVVAILSVASLLQSAAVAFLGIVAIVLGVRAVPGSVATFAAGE